MMKVDLGALIIAALPIIVAATAESYVSRNGYADIPFLVFIEPATVWLVAIYLLLMRFGSVDFSRGRLDEAAAAAALAAMCALVATFTVLAASILAAGFSGAAFVLAAFAGHLAMEGAFIKPIHVKQYRTTSALASVAMVLVGGLKILN